MCCVLGLIDGVVGKPAVATTHHFTLPFNVWKLSVDNAFGARLMLGIS